MLQAKGNAKDRDAKANSKKEMNQGQPPAAEHKPDDIANETQGAGADVGAADVGTVDDVGAKGPQIQQADIESGPGPGNANDGDHHKECRGEPGQCCGPPAEEKP